MTSRYDIAAIKKQLAAAEQHDKEIYGEKVRKLLLEKTNLDSLKDVLHDYDIIVRSKKRDTSSEANSESLDKDTNDTGDKMPVEKAEEPIKSENVETTSINLHENQVNNYDPNDWADDAEDEEDDDSDDDYTDVDFGLESGK